LMLNGDSKAFTTINDRILKKQPEYTSRRARASRNSLVSIITFFVFRKKDLEQTSGSDPQTERDGARMAD